MMSRRMDEASSDDSTWFFYMSGCPSPWKQMYKYPWFMYGNFISPADAWRYEDDESDEEATEECDCPVCCE